MCDDFDVKSLPWNFESLSKPSKNITKLLERKEYEHNLLIECMRRKVKRVNIEVDAKIKMSSEMVKKKLTDIKEDVKMHFIDLRFKEANLDFEEDYLLKALRTVTKFNKKEYLAVEDFCKSLTDIEASRSQKFKELLKESKLKAVEVAHELPFALDEMFELEILALNQVTMSNYCHYSELEKELKLQVKNDLKLWTGEIMEIKEIIRERLKMMAKKSAAFVEDMLKEDVNQSKSLILANELQRLNSLKSEFNYIYFGEDSIPVSEEEVEKWLKEVQSTLASLDQSAKNIVELYKSTITILFNRFLDELEGIKNAMMKTGVCHKKEIEDFRCEIYTPAAEELNIKVCSQLEDLQQYWGSTIKDMTDTVNVTYTFLKSAACLWDKHFQRVRELQELVLKDIEKTIKNNARLTETYEANVNVAIDKLRQGDTEKNLKKSLTDIYKILDKMESSYNTQSYNEINVVHKYKTMMDIEIDVLMSEIKRFLVIHPPDSDRDPKLQRRRASQISIREEEERFLPMQILYCVFQVDAVKNWMFGLWEAINQYLSTGRQEILNLTEEWVDAQIEKIQERRHVKLAFHRPRYEHVKCSIYEKRFRELLLHSHQLDCQKKFADYRKKQLKAYKSTYEENCQRCCQEYEEESQKIITDLGNMNSSYMLRSFSHTIKIRLERLENNLKKLTTDYKEMCNNCVDELKISNYEYVMSVKLFSEGGNFSPKEFTILQKCLSKLENSSTKQIQTFIKGIEVTDEKCFARLQAADGNIISTLNEYIREHEHNERLVKKIFKFQGDLRQKVNSLKQVFQNCEGKLQDVNNEAKVNMGKVEYLAEFLPLFQSYINEVIDIGDFIMHPEPVDLFSITTEHLNKNKLTTFGDKLLNRKSPLNGKDFLSTIVTLLHTSFNELEIFSKEFYNKYHQKLLLDSTKLQPTFEDCTTEVLQKYKGYLLQCEICWMENVSAFLSLLNNIKFFQDGFLVSFENAFCRICIEGLNLAIADIWQQLNNQAETFNRRLKEIHNRLKVMFGHPKNKKMLQELEEDYTEISKDNQQKFSEIIPPQKEYLKKIYELLNSELQEVQSSLSVLLEDDRIKQLMKQLTKQLETKTHLLCPVVYDQIGEGTSQISISKDTVEYIQNYVNLSQSDLGLEAPSLQILSLNTLSSQKTFETPENFLLNLQERILSTELEMKNFVDNRMVKANEDFKQSWAEDIKYILNLYKVKYDNKIF